MSGCCVLSQAPKSSLLAEITPNILEAMHRSWTLVKKPEDVGLGDLESRAIHIKVSQVLYIIPETLVQWQNLPHKQAVSHVN